jgi:hypothetical protein
MSQALAAARKRRSPQSPIPSASACTVGSKCGPNPEVRSVSAPSAGLTLPQVIELIDRRLITLETHAKEQLSQRSIIDATESPALNEILDEYQNRFEILAEELASLKHIVLNLQSYTMDVNKKLLGLTALKEDDKPNDENLVSESASVAETEVSYFA